VSSSRGFRKFLDHLTSKGFFEEVRGEPEKTPESSALQSVLSCGSKYVGYSMYQSGTVHADDM
jgi:hypothetical protein